MSSPMASGCGKTRLLQPWTLVAVLVLGGLLAYLPGLGQHSHLASHEGRHAEIAREMWKTGQYAVPHFGGRIYSDKPPLFHWLVSGAFAVFGRADLMLARLPSALAAVSGAVSVFFFGRLLYGIGAGFVAAAMLLSTQMYARWAVMCRMDMVMSVALVWATTFTALASRAGSAGVRWAWIGAACLALTAAVLTKGLVPLAVGIGLVAVTWLCLSDRRRLVAPVLLLALLAAATAGAAWAASTLGTDFLADFWRFQTSGTGPKHVSSLGYYLPRFPLGLLPWSLWLPFAVWDAAARFGRSRRLPAALPLLALVAGFVAFSLFSNKRVHYLLPFTPFAALLVGDFAVRRLHDGPDKAYARVIGYGLSVVLLCTPLAVLGILHIQKGSIRAGFAAVLIVLSALAVLCVYGLRCVAAKRPKHALAAMLAAGLLLCGTLPGVVGRYYWLPEPDVAEAQAIAHRVPPDVPVGLLALGETLSFELPDPPLHLISPDQAEPFVSGPGRKCIVAAERDVAALREAFGDRIESAASVSYPGRQPYAVIVVGAGPSLRERHALE